MNKLVITCCTGQLNNLNKFLSISKYKYNHDWFTRWCACGIDLACGKYRLAEKEWPTEENEGDTDLRFV
jgi:hypothetical protein